MSAPRTHGNNFNLIRLLAALQVLAVHALNHLDFDGPLVTALKVVPGVPTFFFISGLLICMSYERMQAQGLRAFFTNRALRIFPALWACVAASTLAVLATGYLGTQSFSISHFVAWVVGQASFAQFYNPGFMREFGVGVLNGALWTITVELQFYLLTPLLFHLMTRRRTLFALLFVASLALNIWFRLYLDWSRLGMKLAYVSFVPWVYMFMLGFAIAHWRPKLQAIEDRLRLRWLVPAYVASMIFVGSYDANASNAINPVSYLLLALCLLKLSTLRLPLPARVTDFVARNDFSYGMYLYHMPVINLLLFLGWFTAHGSVVAAFAVSTAAALLSWFLVEKPALSLKR